MIEVFETPGVMPQAATMLLGSPVRGEQFIQLAHEAAHQVAGRSRRVVHHIVCPVEISMASMSVIPLYGASPLGDVPTVRTTWTLGPLATQLAVSVRYQGGRNSAIDNDASMLLELVRRSDDSVIDDGEWAAGRLRAGDHTGSQFVGIWAHATSGLILLDVDGYAGEKVELVIVGEDVRILAVSAWEVWPESVA